MRIAKCQTLFSLKKKQQHVFQNVVYCSYDKRFNDLFPQITVGEEGAAQLAFFINLQRAVIGPSGYPDGPITARYKFM